MNNIEKMEKTKIVPELRFPEFANKGEWKGEKLGALSDIIIGGTPSTVVEEYWNGSIGWIGSGEIKNDVIKSPTKYITELGLKKSSTYLLPKGTTVLAMTGATLGKIGFLDQEFCGNQSVAGFINLRNLNSKFLFYQLLNETKQILSFAGGGAQAGINKSNIESIVIQVPKNADNKNIEQQKIADCLTSLDEVITAHTDKLETLKKHKKGLLQNLFPDPSTSSGGQKVPNYRFPEFVNDGEWEEKTLGDIAELTSSKRVHLADYVSNGIPFFRGKEISQLKNNQFPSDILYISNEQYNEIKNKYGVPEKGDILITAVGTLGNVYYIKDEFDFYFKDGNLIWIKNILINGYFLEILLDVVKEKILESAIGSSQKALTMLALNKIELKVPKNPKEQQKIADSLLAVDKLITAQAEKIEQLKAHKKGLMQGLFPKVND